MIWKSQFLGKRFPKLKARLNNLFREKSVLSNLNLSLKIKIQVTILVYFFRFKFGTCEFWYRNSIYTISYRMIRDRIRFRWINTVKPVSLLFLFFFFNSAKCGLKQTVLRIWIRRQKSYSPISPTDFLVRS